MLFAAIYRPREAGASEEAQKRSTALFTSWEPPFEFKAHYARGDGRGGIAVIETDDAQSIVEGISPWQPFFEFEVTPIIPIEEAVPLFLKTNAWRDSIS